MDQNNISESNYNQGHSNVYVRGLPSEINEELLESLFQPFGAVQSFRIFRSNQKTTKSTFAFVKYNNVTEAEAAIEELNGISLAGEVIEVRMADNDAGASSTERSPPPSDNIYCKNLPAGFGDDELRQLFGQFGSVVTSRVLHQGDATGQGGAALVRLSSTEDAAYAVHTLQGHRVVGALHPLIIRFADSAEIKAKKQAKQGSTSSQSSTPALPAGLAGSSLSLSGQNPNAILTGHASSALAGQSSLAAHAASAPSGSAPPLLANPTASAPAAHAAIPTASAIAGHAAAVTLPGHIGSAQNWLSPVGGLTTNNPIFTTTQLPSPASFQHLSSTPGVLPSYFASLSSAQPLQTAAPLGNHQAQISAPLGNRGGGSSGTSAGSLGPPAISAMAVASLYVKNLPLDADKLFLYEKFAPFGAILSVKILTDEQGASRGVGFVNFSDAACSAKAMSALHNLPLGDRNLFVAFQTHHRS